MMHGQSRRGFLCDFISIAGPLVALALVALYLFVRFAS